MYRFYTTLQTFLTSLYILPLRVGDFGDFFEKNQKSIFLIKIRFFLFESESFDFFSKYAVFLLKIGQISGEKITQ